MKDFPSLLRQMVNTQLAARGIRDPNVLEAMCKGTPVIGGNVGGIRYQIEDGVNGFLVSSVEEAAQRIVQLIKDRDLRERMGKKARETVRQRFLLIRLLEQHLDPLNSFETFYRLQSE